MIVEPPKWHFDELEVLAGQDWIWQLHENQSYLGRLIIRLRRPTNESFATCTIEEWDSLRLQLRAYETLLSRLFSPDRYNYCQLGNIWEQLHVHAIPRYKTARQWCSYDFRDQRWGRNWPPAPLSPLNVSATYDFAKWLRLQIENDAPIQKMLEVSL
jgi:diadenosine tetraphosphate (Ap4A) HIT family hydrolase